MQTPIDSNHPLSWLEESILSYLQNNVLPEELSYRPKRLAKLFEELLLNTTYHTTEFEELKNRLFETILEKVLAGSLKINPTLKVIRSICHLDGPIFNQSKLIFFIGPYRIEGNKLLWIINSPFIKALLSNTFLESEKKEIQLREVPFEDFKKLNAYVNEGDLDIDEIPIQKLFSLMQSAEYFQIDEFKKNCLEELQKRVSIETIGDILCQLCIQDLPALYSKCQAFLRKSFITLSREDNLMVMALDQKIGIESIKLVKRLLNTINLKINVTGFLKKGNTNFALHYKKKLELIDLLRMAKSMNALTHVNLHEADFAFENYTILNNNDALLDKITSLRLEISNNETVKLIFRSCSKITHFSGILNSDQMNYLLKYADQLYFLEFLEGSEFYTPLSKILYKFSNLKELVLSRNIQAKEIIWAFKHLQNLQTLTLYTGNTAIQDLKRIFKKFSGKFHIVLKEISNTMSYLTEEIISQSFLEADGYRVTSHLDSVFILKDPMLETSQLSKRQRDESEQFIKKHESKQKKIKSDLTSSES